MAYNRRKLKNWITAHKPIFEKEFYQFGVSPNPKDPSTIPYSPTSYSTYATGRENISSLTVDFEFIARHNPISLSLEYILSFFFSFKTPADNVMITIVPSPKAGIAPGIFGVVNKDMMKTVRDDYYFYSLTRTSDSAKLPDYLAFMSEHNDLTEAYFTPELQKALADPRSENLFKYFAITDLSKERPKEIEDLVSRPTVYLVMNAPKNADEMECSTKIIQAVIGFVDVAAEKTKIRPEVQKKIKAVRETELKKIIKIKEEIKAEELAKKKDEEKRKRRNEISNLSPAEQKKAEQREREKEQRKMRNRQMKRM